MRRRRSRVHRALVLGVMLGGAFGCGPIAVAPQPPLEVADAIVVLGNRPPVDRDGNVQPETRRRVATGVGLWFRGLAPVIVMTGGPAPFGVVEADVMRDAAVRLGVPPARVLTERASTDTIGNARGTVSMLCRQGLQRAGACRPSVIIVSSPYHLGRARALFECAGARVQLAATPTPQERDYHLRFAWNERMIRWAYGFFDPCALARPR